MGHKRHISFLNRGWDVGSDLTINFEWCLSVVRSVHVGVKWSHQASVTQWNGLEIPK